MNSFSRSVDLLHRAMDVSSLRYSVSAHNLANAGTSNFKRTTVNFEEMLKRAIESEKTAGEAFQLKTSDPRHIKSKTFIDYRTVEPRRVLDYTGTTNANGNNVDAEFEAMNVLKTQLNYQLLTQMQSFQFSQMQIVLK